MLRLYGYWRSGASYRVRIALSLKGLAYDYIPVHLLKDGGEQLKPEFRALNPQARVPLLVDGEFRLAQSMAILDYLEHKAPQPALLPADAKARARVLAFCQVINGDTQPLQNTGVVNYLRDVLKLDEAARTAWVRHWIERSLGALEEERRGQPESAYVFGATPTWADCLLIPQIYSAERYGCEASKYPRLSALAHRVREEPAFAAAHPDRQPDAQKA